MAGEVYGINRIPVQNKKVYCPLVDRDIDVGDCGDFKLRTDSTLSLDSVLVDGFIHSSGEKVCPHYVAGLPWGKEIKQVVCSYERDRQSPFRLIPERNF